MPGGPDAVSGDAQVHSITDAATAHSEEMRERMIKYAVAMGIRMVCLILVFVVDGWFKVVPIAGAVFLPWIAVVIANGSDKAEIHSDYLLDSAPLAGSSKRRKHRQLPKTKAQRFSRANSSRTKTITTARNGQLHEHF